MNLNTVIFKRRRILGDLYSQCQGIDNIPVYLDDAGGEPVGTVEESPAQYGDAFVFKLPADICKLFSVDGYDVGVDYDYVDKNKTTNRDPIKMNHIILIAKPKASPYGKRGSRQAVEKEEIIQIEK